MKHVIVYKEPGRFGGWPANHGIWSWGDEIVVGFSAGYYKDQGPTRHHIDHGKPEEHLLARTLDGGLTWSIENPSEQDALKPQGPGLHGITPPEATEPEVTDLPEPIDFTDPDFAMTVRMWDIHTGPSRIYYSFDRCRTWKGPYELPLFGRKGIAGRTDYIVNGPRDCMLFLTAAKENGKEGRPICVRTTDGGLTWEFVRWIGPEPEQGFAIMPSTVRLKDGGLLTAIRRREGSKRWIETWRSDNDGWTWEDPREVADTGEGNPASMILLADGRVCLTYGYRAEPFGIRARLSSDDGRTWEPILTLRDDGGCRDIGYPRTVQRPDGQIVTVYYFADAPQEERYIAATIWTPEELEP